MNARGFTFYEVLIAIPLLGLLTLLAMGELRAVSRSSARAVRGASELTLAADFAARFRNDVRSASAVALAPQGDGVALRAPESVITYQRRADGRLERAERAAAPEEEEQVSVGPRVASLRFALVEGQGLRLLRVQWLCAADAEGDPVTGAPPPNTGTVLVLDTALRVSAEDRP